jgi:Phage integrase SAM-like domain
MASIYRRPETSYIWITYKGEDGKRKRVNTGYRWDNNVERLHAEKLAKAKTFEELRNKPIKERGGWDWIPEFIEARWGHKQNGTLHLRKLYYHRFRQFVDEKGIVVPGALRREHAPMFLEWRKEKGCGRNTAIAEIKSIGTILEEAVARGYINANPFRKLGFKQEAQEHKTPWTLEQVNLALEAAEKKERFGWLHVALLLGRYQAIRIGQCRVPIVGVDLARRIIHYPDAIVKGGKGYSQPIDPEFHPLLSEIVEHRRKLGKSNLCDLPQLPSVVMRRFLDSLARFDVGFNDISHHGLRATWITQAALSGVITETLAKRFVNHASSEVHAIYQRITATDLLPMLDAFVLARNKQEALPQLPEG